MASKLKADYKSYLAAKHSRFNTSKKVLSSIIKQATGSNPVSIIKVIRGEVNEVYDITTQSGISIVIRISRSQKPRFYAEEWSLNRCLAIGIPVPKIILLTSQVVDGQQLTFCVENKLPGTPLKDLLNPTPTQIQSLVVQSGVLLSQIHSVIPDAGFGGLNHDGVGKYQSWSEYLLEVVDNQDAIRDSGAKSGLTPHTLSQAFGILQSHVSLTLDVTPHLLHGDYSSKHLLVSNDVISGIIDFENCKSGDPVWDFAWWNYFFAQQYPLAWLIAGYIQKSQLPRNFEQKLLLYKIRLGLELIYYYEKENNYSGMDHSKQQLEADTAKFQSL
jgi:aminoglycoside phosphotransferase (APT) family kinase protein